jgi:hypothetical protein
LSTLIWLKMIERSEAKSAKQIFFKFLFFTRSLASSF